MGADEAAKMLKALLPPQVLPEQGAQVPPQARAKIMQLTQGVQQLQEAAQKLQQENVQLKAGIAETQIRAQAEERIEKMRLQAEMRLEAMRQMMESRDAEMQRRVEEAEARRETEFKRWEALLEARTDIAVARINAENRPEPAQAQ